MAALVNFRRLCAEFRVEPCFVVVEIPSFAITKMRSLNGYNETQSNFWGTISHIRSLGAPGTTHSRLMSASVNVGLDSLKLWPKEIC